MAKVFEANGVNGLIGILPIDTKKIVNLMSLLLRRRRAPRQQKRLINTLVHGSTLARDSHGHVLGSIYHKPTIHQRESLQWSGGGIPFSDTLQAISHIKTVQEAARIVAKGFEIQRSPLF